MIWAPLLVASAALSLLCQWARLSCVVHEFSDWFAGLFLFSLAWSLVNIFPHFKDKRKNGHSHHLTWLQHPEISDCLLLARRRFFALRSCNNFGVGILSPPELWLSTLVHIQISWSFVVSDPALVPSSSRGKHGRLENAFQGPSKIFKWFPA